MRTPPRFRTRGLGGRGERATGNPPRPLAGRCFQPVAEGAVVTALEAPFFTLALSRFDQVFQTPRALNRRLPALGAAPVALHSQLVFSLPRNRQASELVIYAFSHFFHLRPAKWHLSWFDQSTGPSTQSFSIIFTDCHAKLAEWSGGGLGRQGSRVRRRFRRWVTTLQYFLVNFFRGASSAKGAEGAAEGLAGAASGPVATGADPGSGRD